MRRQRPAECKTPAEFGGRLALVTLSLRPLASVAGAGHVEAEGERGIAPSATFVQRLYLHRRKVEGAIVTGIELQGVATRLTIEGEIGDAAVGRDQVASEAEGVAGAAPGLACIAHGDRGLDPGDVDAQVVEIEDRGTGIGA